MQKSELWRSGINDEYCWVHALKGWDCIQCRVAVTLPEFFTALVAILDEALECHELLPSQVQQFEIATMPPGLKSCWVEFDEKYYTEVLMLNGKLDWSVNGIYSDASESERLLALNEQKAQEDGQDAEFYNLMAEAQ